VFTIICGRRVPVLVFVLVGLVGGLLLAVASGVDPRVAASLFAFCVLVVVLNAVSGRSRPKPP